MTAAAVELPQQSQSWLFRRTEHAALYAKYRPVYPSQLYHTIWAYFLEGRPEVRGQGGQGQSLTAVDVGCGCGHSTLALCPYFDHVIGMDQSEAQIAEARLTADEVKAKVTYRVGVAHELTFLDDASVDMVTAAAALHWFDVDKFYSEAGRVLKSGGVLAAYTYTYNDESMIKHSDEADRIWDDIKAEIQRLSVSSANRHTDGYRELHSLLPPLYSHSQRDCALRLELVLTVDELVGFVRSWGIYQRAATEYGQQLNVFDNCLDRIAALYSNSSEPIVLVLPVYLLLARK